MNSNQISKAVRYALVAGAVSAVAAPSAFAADATTTTDQTANSTNTAQLGKIEVTGTRIKRTDVETAQPVTIVTNAQLKASGLANIGDILRALPSTGASENLQVNNGNTSGFAGQGGQTHVDLRNLGQQRVLVLVNGKRWVEQLNNTVDLNEIPLSVIDHVEVLQDGASAIYGSDAISGVVNIITVKNYNGAEANAYFGIMDGKNDGGGWDGKQKSVDFTIGSSADKSAVLLNVSYEEQDPIWAGSRTTSKEPHFTQSTFGGSSSTPNGRFLYFGKALAGKTFGQTQCNPVYNPASHSYGTCSMTLISGGKTSKPVPTSNFRTWQPNDHFNFAPLNYLMTPTDITGMYTQAHYDLASNLTFTTEATYTRRVSSQVLAPNPLQMGIGWGAGAIKADGINVGIGKTNPYNPFGVDLVANVSQYCPTGTNGCTPNELVVLSGRRPLEAGPRIFNENSDTLLYRGAFSGYFDVGGNEWDWDAGYSFGNTYESDVTNGFFNTIAFAHALDAPGFTPCSQTPGCVPFNFLGGAPSITPAMLRYVTYEDHALFGSSQRDYTVNLTGQLADLPAGPLGAAFGAEYIENDGFDHPDALTSENNSTQTQILPTDGRIWTRAEYLEFDIPLVADAPGVKSMDLDLADRWTQVKWKGGTPGTNESTYQFKGSATTPRAALKWAVNDEFLARASWSKGFRVPALNELYFSGAQNFPAVSDPCAGNGALPAGCQGHHHTQPSTQILTLIGGNPNLHPETAISRTVGFVYNPNWMPGFDFSLDYYKIDIGQTLAAQTPQNLVNGCYIASNAADCALITTFQNKIITGISDITENIGETETRGIDLSTHYKFPSTSVGDFKLGLDWNFTQSFKTTVANPGAPSGFSSTETAGTATQAGGVPAQRATLTLNWNYGDWSAYWSVQYIHAMWEGCATDLGATAATLANFSSECSNFTTGSPVFGPGGNLKAGVAGGVNHMGATFYHDVQATYHADGINTDFTFGIRNLFDKIAPNSLSAFANSMNTEFDRIPGRQFYVRAGVKF